MASLDEIKKRINCLYHTNAEIHISVSMTRPKVSVDNDTVVIKGVYPHIFQIEECSSGMPRLRTIRYADILTKNIKINELGEI